MRLFSALAAALAVAAAPLALSADTPAPIHIPVILSLTGNGAFPGNGDRISLQLIEKMVNATGGIGADHRPLQFDITDDGSNPQTAVQLQNQVLATKAPLMIGPSLTQQCSAVVPLVRDAGPMQYCLSPGLNPAPGGFILSSNVSIKDAVVAAIGYFRARGLTRMAILSSTDATGQEADRDYEYARSLPANKAVEFVAREHFNLSDVSVDAQVARIKAANPQVVLTWTVGPAFGTELHSIQNVGLDIPILGSNGDLVSTQLSSYKAFMPKELIFTGVLPSVPSAVGPGPVKDAIGRYVAAFKAAGIRPEFPNTLGWDPGLIVVDALRHLGPSATAQQYREYLNSLHGFVGILGVYDFRDGTQHGIGQNAVIMVRWDPEAGDVVAVSKRGGLLK